MQVIQFSHDPHILSSCKPLSTHIKPLVLHFIFLHLTVLTLLLFSKENPTHHLLQLIKMTMKHLPSGPCRCCWKYKYQEKERAGGKLPVTWHLLANRMFANSVILFLLQVMKRSWGNVSCVTYQRKYQLTLIIVISIIKIKILFNNLSYICFLCISTVGHDSKWSVSVFGT